MDGASDDDVDAIVCVAAGGVTVTSSIVGDASSLIDVLAESGIFSDSDGDTWTSSCAVGIAIMGGGDSEAGTEGGEPILSLISIASASLLGCLSGADSSKYPLRLSSSCRIRSSLFCRLSCSPVSALRPVPLFSTFISVKLPSGAEGAAPVALLETSGGEGVAPISLLETLGCLLCTAIV